MIIPLLSHAVTFLVGECLLKCYKANILCSLYVELMNWLVQLVECNLFVLSWILERQTMACLLSCSRQLMSAAPPMQMQAAILHKVTQRQPLGRYLCPISVTWLFSNIHVTADCSKSLKKFVVKCPYCEQLFDCYFWAGVRYRYLGKLEGCSRILSELDAIPDSADEADSCVTQADSTDEHTDSEMVFFR